MSNNPQFNTYYHPAEVRLPHPVAAEKAQKPRRWLKRVLLGLLAIFVLFILTVGWVSYKLFHDSSKVFGGSTFSNMTKAFAPTTLKGEDNHSVNLLVVGVSTDDPGHPGADLTDSLMLLNMNPANNKVNMISIPRDLWVYIPGVGHRKINEAFHWGNFNNFNDPNYPAGGIGLLEQVVSQNLGITLNYYAIVNYSALRNVVNTLGGVDIDIQSPDPRGLYDPNISSADGGPLKLPNGRVHLDGQTALNLARARGDPAPDGRLPYGFPQSDLNRTEHQRQLVSAIQKKMFSFSTLLNPTKLTSLFDGISGNVTTDLKINEARRIASLFHRSKNQQSVGLNPQGQPLLRGYATSTGEDALIPTLGTDDYSAIQAYIQNKIQSTP